MFDFLSTRNNTQPEVSLNDLKERLHKLTPATPREQFAHEVCELALQARQAGNYGIGAILCRGEEVIYRASNAVFFPHRDSSAHAEMQLLDQWEQGGRQGSVTGPEALTLICSLEPCPMCLARILMSGITRIYYLADDPQGGMLKQARHLPPAFRNLLQRCEQGVLYVDSGYISISHQLAQQGIAELRAQLLN